MMKPTIFCGVPRVYDRIYTGLRQIQNNFIVLNSNWISCIIIICGSH